MRAVMVMFDSLNRDFLPGYGCDWTVLPNFRRLQDHTITFDTFYAGSLPCIPARRELHTGRYNFLHRSWSPLEPFDDSVIARLTRAGVYTHIVTDHFHYWEDGGSSYLTKYNSHEMFRGQQGDLWTGQVADPEYPETASEREGSTGWRHDWANRQVIDAEEKMPTAQTVAAGLEFLERNHESDNWFLQIECFDPHEPFYTQSSWQELYPDSYAGPQLDWPDYGRNGYTATQTEHVRRRYAALLSMCDHYLGRVLDAFDSHNLWHDTMLILNTDHGFLLGEQQMMGKNVQPFYNEVAQLPFFIYDPRHPVQGERRTELAQTVDIAPTLAEFFEVDPPEHLSGRSLYPAIADDKQIRAAGLFGIHGGHVNVTDGTHVYMHAPHSPENGPLYEYTLAPSHMREQFSVNELQEAELDDGFDFTQGARILKIPARAAVNSHWWGHQLFDVQDDPNQREALDDPHLQAQLLTTLRDLMVENDAPAEQFQRLGVPRSGAIPTEALGQHDPFEPLIRERIGAVPNEVVHVVALWLLQHESDRREAALVRLGEVIDVAAPPVTAAEAVAVLRRIDEPAALTALLRLHRLYFGDADVNQP